MVTAQVPRDNPHRPDRPDRPHRPDRRDNLPTLETIWRWLDEVADPEIPVISLVDLGIIQDIRWQNDRFEITVTPTYSGCPATAAINLDIGEKLRQKGIEDFTIQQRLVPAWTTDWISEAGRAKLRAYGITPPAEAAVSCVGVLKQSAVPRAAIACPRCASENTECISRFGSTPCKAAYRCRDCLEPFDYFKPF